MVSPKNSTGDFGLKISRVEGLIFMAIERSLVHCCLQCFFETPSNQYLFLVLFLEHLIDRIKALQ